MNGLFIVGVSCRHGQVNFFTFTKLIFGCRIQVVFFKNISIIIFKFELLPHFGIFVYVQ